MGIQVRSPSVLIKTLNHAHSGATTSKVPVVIGTHVYLPLNDADAAEANAYVYEAEISGADTPAAQAWALGDAIYWDAGNAQLTNVAGANVLCGFAIEAKLAADTVCGLVAFNAFAVV